MLLLPRLALAALASALPAAPLPAQAADSTLALVALDGTTRTLSPAELAALPQVEVRVPDGDSDSATFRGPTLRALLTLAGAPEGRELRGPNLTLVFLAEASDGYRVAYALAEVDEQFGARQAILALTRDGRPLPARDGPHRQPIRFARQRRKRMIGPEDIGRSVDQMQMTTLAECAGHVASPVWPIPAMNGAGALDKSRLSAFNRLMQALVTRLFRPDDLAACLAVFDSNLPRFFAVEERDEFADFLQKITQSDDPYLVLQQESRIVACGGLSSERDTRQASLSWGMVDQNLHGQGLGRELTQARINLAKGMVGIDRLTLATSQHTRGFYERFGFVIQRLTPNGFGLGLDRCDMLLAFDRQT